jgi:ADP-ribosylglycohydrolase
MQLTEEQLNRAAGVLVATASGDSLGAGYEFKPAFSKDIPVEMIGGGPFRWAEGEWTDDTAMTLCIAKAIIAAADKDQGPCSRYALAGAVANWKIWSREAKDIGPQTRSVFAKIHRFQLAGMDADLAAFKAAEMFHDLNNEKSAGIGALMRTSPVALAFLDSELELWDAAKQFCLLTHYELDAVEACQIWTVAIRHAVITGELDVRRGVALLEDDRRRLWMERIVEAESGQPADFKDNSWVVHGLQGAWSSIFNALQELDGLNGAALRLSLENAVRGGNDTDSVAAVAGGLIGAVCGYDAVPLEWREIIHGYGAESSDELRDLGRKLARESAERTPNLS